MFYLIGIGIYDEKDISIRGLNAMKKCSKVYFESYTNTSNIDIKSLSEMSGKKIIELNREKTEAGEFIKSADSEDIALLVPGDPLNATTHISLIVQCRENNIGYSIIHASGIMSAIAETGLSSYRFGEATTIPWPREDYKPISFVETIKRNQRVNLHSLILLDTQPLMSIQQALEIIIGTKQNVIKKDTKLIAVSALGSESPQVIYDSVERLTRTKMKGFPQSLIMPAKLNHIEEEMVNLL